MFRPMSHVNRIGGQSSNALGVCSPPSRLSRCAPAGGAPSRAVAASSPCARLNSVHGHHNSPPFPCPSHTACMVKVSFDDGVPLTTAPPPPRRLDALHPCPQSIALHIGRNECPPPRLPVIRGRQQPCIGHRRRPAATGKELPQRRVVVAGPWRGGGGLPGSATAGMPNREGARK